MIVGGGSRRGGLERRRFAERTDSWPAATLSACGTRRPPDNGVFQIDRPPYLVHRSAMFLFSAVFCAVSGLSDDAPVTGPSATAVTPGREAVSGGAWVHGVRLAVRRLVRDAFVRVWCTSGSAWHRWWEFGLTSYEILLLQRLGLATDIIQPRPVAASARN